MDTCTLAETISSNLQAVRSFGDIPARQCVFKYLVDHSLSPKVLLDRPYADQGLHLNLILRFPVFSLSNQNCPGHTTVSYVKVTVKTHTVSEGGGGNMEISRQKMQYPSSLESGN